MTSNQALQDRFFSAAQADLFRALCKRAQDTAVEFLTESERSIGPETPIEKLAASFSDSRIPEDPKDFDVVLAEARKLVLEESVHLANARYIGHMTGNLPMAAYVVEFLVAVMNQNVVKIETALAASLVERQLLQWLHRMIFNAPEEEYRRAHLAIDCSLGNITNGGTMGNLTALTVARNTLLPGIADDGLSVALERAGLRRLVILASRRVHYSIRKSASLLGVGANNVLEIPVEGRSNKVSLTAMRAMLTRMREEGTGVVAIVGAAGTTETGAIDNLAALANLAEEFGVWFHADAAWGGALLTSERGRKLLAGIERADSVVLDGHKLFFMPLNHGAVLFRSNQALDAIRHSANYIIRPGSLDLGRTSLEGSRRFDSFKMWFMLKHLGRTGLASLVDHSLTLATEFARRIAEHPAFELTSELETNILTYRYVPRAWQPALERVRHQTSFTPQEQEALTYMTNVLNRVNTEVQKRQRRAGHSFVSRTRLDSVVPGFDTVVLRAVLFNPRTTSDDLAAILAEQERLGAEVSKEILETSESCPPDAFFSFSGCPPTQPF